MRSARTAHLSTILLGAALAAGATACTDGTDGTDTGTTAEEIIGGVPVRSPKLDAVGALGYFDGAGFRPRCSATLISPTLVLTAEHCVDFVGDPTTELRFLIGFDAFHPTRSVPVRGIVMEQSWAGGYIGLGNDIAVVHLAEPVIGVTPLPIATPTADLRGKHFAGIGYGRQDALGNYGTRMTGTMTYQQSGGRMFEAIYGSFAGFLADADRYGVDPSTPDGLAAFEQAWEEYRLLDDGVEGWFGNGPGNAQACHGDSGGPIALAVNGKTTVFGVASWVAWVDEQALCELGAAYATLNSTAMDFIAYETACPMIPREGTCADLTTAVRCATPAEGGYRELRTDCSALGLICGTDETGALGCVEDPCDGVPTEGICEGDVAVRCTSPAEGPRRPVSTDCATVGATCAIVDGQATCEL